MKKLFAVATIQKEPPEVFYRKGVLKNFAKFLGKHECRSLFLHEIAGFEPLMLLKRDSGTGVSLWILGNF